jgi:hypothetical protein
MSPEDAALKFSEVATTVAPSQFDVLGGTQLPGPTLQEQFAENAAPKMSEALPWLLDERVQGALAQDPDYQALLERQEAARLAGGTMGLSPGASVATLGNLAQGAASGMQERARMAQVAKDIEIQRENQFIRDTHARNAQLDNALRLQEAIRQTDTIKKKNWREAAAYIAGASEELPTMSPAKAGVELRRVSELINDMGFEMDPDNPEWMAAWIGLHRYRNQLQAIVDGIPLPPIEGGTPTTGGTGLEGAAGQQKQLKEVQSVLAAIHGTPPSSN